MDYSSSLPEQMGFTLFEVLIYCALFSMLTSSLLAVSWTLRESMARSSNSLTTLEQANFVQTKLAKLLDQSAVVSPSGGNKSTALIFRQANGDMFTIDIDSGQLVLKPEQLPAAPLTPQASTASNLSIEQLKTSQLIIAFTLNGQTFTTHKQLVF